MKDEIGKFINLEGDFCGDYQESRNKWIKAKAVFDEKYDIAKGAASSHAAQLKALAELEEKNASNESIKDRIKDISLPKMQLSIFDAHSQTFEGIRLLLENTDINRLTPVEALLKLQEIKNKIQ